MHSPCTTRKIRTDPVDDDLLNTNAKKNFFQQRPQQAMSGAEYVVGNLNPVFKNYLLHLFIF